MRAYRRVRHPRSLFSKHSGYSLLMLGILLGLATAGCDVVGLVPEPVTPAILPAEVNLTPTLQNSTPSPEFEASDRGAQQTNTPPVSGIEQQASSTPAGTVTSTPWPTPTTPCYRADYLRDVLVVDGTRFDPGEILLKVWRIKNSGTCSWHGELTLQFLSGDTLAGPDGLPPLFYQPGSQLEPRLDETNWSDLRLFDVRPGQDVDLVAFFRAPDEEGEYRSLWQLTGPAGQPLGQVYLFIRVRSTSEISLRSWTGLWRQQSPEGAAQAGELALQQTGQSLRGYYYDPAGVPQWIDATVSVDGTQAEGAVGELWSDGSVFYLEKLAGGYQFQGRLEGGPFAVSPWCGARGSAQIPLSRCLLQE